MRLYFDESNKDLYISTNNECLCFSASINSFISFFPYSALNCMFTYNDNFYALKNDTVNNKLYQLFTGEYNGNQNQTYRDARHQVPHYSGLHAVVCHR